MKRLVEVVEGQGMEALLGQKISVFCMRYIYYGELVGVNDQDIILKDCSIVYETGAFQADKFADAQEIAREWRIRTDAIESYGRIKG